MLNIVLHIQPGFQVEGYPRCFSGTPYAHKVQRVLRYKGLAFSVHEVGWLERAETLPKLSGSNKLPVLDYGDQRLEDSTDICLFLDQHHPDPPLIPADPVLAARCHFLDDWSDEVLQWYAVYEQHRITEGDFVADAYFAGLPEDFREVARQRAAEGAGKNLHRQGMGRYPKEKIMADIQRGLDGLCAFIEADGFLAGPAPSLADMAVFGQLHRRMAGTNPWLQEQVTMRPALVDWMGRIDALTG